MTPLREASGHALAALWEVSKNFDAMDSAAERRAAIQALCTESEAASLKASAELKASQHELGKVATELKARVRILDDLKARALNEINERIAEAQGEWGELQGKITKTRQAIDATDASMSSLMRRLRVG